jgi:hypothetical protein
LVELTHQDKVNGALLGAGLVGAPVLFVLVDTLYRYWPGSAATLPGWLPWFLLVLWVAIVGGYGLFGSFIRLPRKVSLLDVINKEPPAMSGGPFMEPAPLIGRAVLYGVMAAPLSERIKRVLFTVAMGAVVGGGLAWFDFSIRR